MKYTGQNVSFGVEFLSNEFCGVPRGSSAK